ncbi:hypothetical protein A8A54_19005 [Brucella pseudogrignonensis]|uniref:alpha/beta fold hydrolase n=1 Tax=Brucella pseudogrignonensis TaxID=419475 RepID=UPI0007DAA73B|nr:alpha/beta hydrolase [Brucella pseudogrignonensis]ANG98700.1 hypothetical protein A8A54_19005 [Brucella pseudogrignonensis]
MLPQLILIPGLLNDAELFRDQLTGLADIARPVVADITRGGTLAELARDVLALAGFSLGGIVAQEILRQFPNRVSHLALMDTTFLPDAPGRAAERQRLIAMARNPGKFHGLGEKLLEAYLAPQSLSNATMARRVRGMTKQLGPEVFIRQSLIEHPDSRPDLRHIACPTLVLCGAHDALTPVALHRDMAVVPDAGHLTPIEQPEAVNAALRPLLARL